MTAKWLFFEAALLALLFAAAPSHPFSSSRARAADRVQFPAREDPPVKGTIEISRTTVEPSSVTLSPPTCGTATVQVFASRGTFTDNPNVTVSLSVFSSDPSTVEVAIGQSSRSQNITESTANFEFEVCARKGAGHVVLKSVITGWSPKDKFDVAAPGAGADVAEITVKN